MKPNKSVKKPLKVGRVLQYRRTHTLKETGEKFGITAERVRQLGQIKHRKRCKVHDRFYFNKCSYCLLEKRYSKHLSRLDLIGVLDEIDYLQEKRDWMNTYRRVEILKQLMNRFYYSLSDVARALHRDYSSVLNLYNRYVLK